MSLFKKVHTVTVPAEFLEKGERAVSLRFSQLNPKKMAKANLNDTLDAIDRQNTIMAKLSDEQRKAAIERQKTTDAESIKRAQERADAPDTFDDFDQHTLDRTRARRAPGRRNLDRTRERRDRRSGVHRLAGR